MHGLVALTCDNCRLIRAHAHAHMPLFSTFWLSTRKSWWCPPLSLVLNVPIWIFVLSSGSVRLHNATKCVSFIPRISHSVFRLLLSRRLSTFAFVEQDWNRRDTTIWAQFSLLPSSVFISYGCSSSETMRHVLKQRVLCIICLTINPPCATPQASTEAYTLLKKGVYLLLCKWQQRRLSLQQEQSRILTSDRGDRTMHSDSSDDPFSIVHFSAWKNGKLLGDTE